jgi:CheY-like chemotaxis protein
MKKIEIACIIDDDPIYVFCTKRIMDLADFCESFLIFHNGKEALDRLSAIIKNDDRLPEVILLDLNMPVMDGWEFLDEFTKIPVAKKVTIYIVTSSIDPADVQKAKQYENVNNYVVKPVTVEMLKDILEKFEKN